MEIKKRQYDSCNSKQQATILPRLASVLTSIIPIINAKTRNAPVYKVENPSYISAAIKETESRFQPHSDIVASRRDVIHEDRAD